MDHDVVARGLNYKTVYADAHGYESYGGGAITLNEARERATRYFERNRFNSQTAATTGEVA